MHDIDLVDNEIGVLFGAGKIASVLGTDERKVRRLLKEGQIKGARKIGSQWTITVRTLLRNFSDDAVPKPRLVK